MQSFKIKFRGVRGSHPTARQSHLKYGGNTSCVEVWAGGHLIILDAGTGIIDLGRDLQKEHILSGTELSERKPINVTLILSHLHQDHIQGLQFFAPAFIPTSKIDVFALPYQNESLKETLSKLLFERVFPVSIDEIPSSFNVREFEVKNRLILTPDGQKKLIQASDFKPEEHIEDVVISVHKTTAHPKNGCLCIKIQYKGKTLVYATDKESYVGCDKKFIEFSHSADILIHDAQYTHQDYISPILPKQGFGHSTFNMAIETAKFAKAKCLVFFHYDPNYDDGILDMLEKEFSAISSDFIFAKENLEINI